jgi:DedD protein
MDKALKQRLVGATVLILLAVIVLPMLLSGQSETLQQETLRIEVPPQPAELSFESRRFPVGGNGNAAPAIDRASEQPSDPEASDPDEDQVAESVLLDQVDVVSNNEAEAEPGPDTEPESLLQAAPPSVPVPDAQAVVSLENRQRYLVQIASFSNTANANRLSSQLKDSGMPVIMDNVETDAGILHRVRVGPFERRERADEVIRLVRQRFSDLKPRVIDLKPGQSAPVTAPSDPMVRWVVQAGSFRQPQHADKLVAQLRQAGFNAYQVKVSDAARTVYKVRVGPEIKRESAVRIAQQINTKFDIEGLVMSAE